MSSPDEPQTRRREGSGLGALGLWRASAGTVAAGLLRPVLNFCPHPPDVPEDGELAAAARGFALVGAALGLGAGLVFVALGVVGLPRAVAGAGALAVGAIATGGLFESGLARFVHGALDRGDGAEAARAATRERAPAYDGIVVVVLAVAAKLGALASLGGTARAAAALIAAEALAWASIPVLRFALPAASERGFAYRMGTPEREEAALAGALGAAVALLVLGPWTGVVALAFAALALAAVYGLAARVTGGVTGAALGAVHQGVAVAVLAAAAAVG